MLTANDEPLARPLSALRHSHPMTATQAQPDHTTPTAAPDWSAIRVSAGYKKAALARHLGVNVATIRRFETADPIMGETTRARLALAYRRLAAEVAAVPPLPGGVGQ